MVSTLLFDDESEVLHDRVSIDQIGKMTDEQYYVRGCTALLDAVGGAISHIGNIHKYARKEDRPEKIIFIITTDGVSMAVCSVMSANSNKEEKVKDRISIYLLYLCVNRIPILI